MNQPGPTEVPVEGRDDRPEPEEEVAEGERARHDDDHLAHRRASQALPPLSQIHSATTVTRQRSVARFHQDARSPGQEQIDPRAEADHAQALSLLHRGSDLVIGDDSPGDEPGDLADQQLAP